MADFSGDGVDDVGTVKAEFYVDGALGYSDVGTSGHYVFGGAPASWDITALANGPHTVKLVVFDTAGQTCAQEATVTVANVPDAAPDAAVTTPDATATDGVGRTLDSGCGCRTGGGNAEERSGGASLALLCAFALLSSARRKRRW